MKLLKLIKILFRFIYPYSLRSTLANRLGNRINLKFVIRDNNLVFARNIKMDLNGTDYGHKQIILAGFYELELSRRIQIIATNESGILFDVGANYGYFSLIWCANNIKNRAYAFEPSPKVFNCLVKNIEKNNIRNRIKCEELAVTNIIGIQKFRLYDFEGQTGWGGLAIEGKSDTIDVKTTTLDNYCFQNKIEKILVLKIDTEGADTLVLYGAQDLLKSRRIKHIFFEINFERMKLLGLKKNDPQEFLYSLGYKIIQVAPNEYYASI